MDIRTKDYNKADRVISNTYSTLWARLESILLAMPLIIQDSLQRGRQGLPVFDPKGTNLHIKDKLHNLGWSVAVPIPQRFAFLGTDVDFAKDGILGETQFAHYALLINNLMRSELFYKSKTIFDQQPTQILMYITKAGIFPSANSSLYYEQAERQFDSFAQNKMFKIPIRLIGLFAPFDKAIAVKYVGYEGRTSRTSTGNRDIKGILASPKGNRRPVLTVFEGDVPVGQAEAQDPDTQDPTPRLFRED